MSKLSDFLTKQKIDPRRIVAVSKRLESHRVEDRSIRLARRRVKGTKATDAEKEHAEKKMRSGRPVAPPALARAMRGDAMSSHAKKRIARAVNHVLATKKKPEVGVGDLF